MRRSLLHRSLQLNSIIRNSSLLQVLVDCIGPTQKLFETALLLARTCLTTGISSKERILSQGRVNIFTLAKNAGTSVNQIERFARHLNRQGFWLAPLPRVIKKWDDAYGQCQA
ncbi:hypothetical protein HYPGJ_20185 [Hyphomicrobium sp. GJ21]|jgi:hypothetical protein|nr:hypothetical protein HYPGJ_20185 [Hyphomicrobium sp. GJ21]